MCPRAQKKKNMEHVCVYECGNCWCSTEPGKRNEKGGKVRGNPIFFGNWSHKEDVCVCVYEWNYCLHVPSSPKNKSKILLIWVLRRWPHTGEMCVDERHLRLCTPYMPSNNVFFWNLSSVIDHTLTIFTQEMKSVSGSIFKKKTDACVCVYEWHHCLCMTWSKSQKRILMCFKNGSLTCVRVYLHINIFIHTFIYSHIYIHVYVHICVLASRVSLYIYSVYTYSLSCIPSHTYIPRAQHTLFLWNLCVGAPAMCVLAYIYIYVWGYMRHHMHIHKGTSNVCMRTHLVLRNFRGHTFVLWDFQFM